MHCTVYMLDKLCNCKEACALTNIASVGKHHLLYYFALNILRMFTKAHTQAALKEHS